MNYVKLVGLVAVAAAALTATFGTGAAAATEIYKYTTPGSNDTLGVGTEIEVSLQPQTSALLKDTAGSTNDTCTSASGKGAIENSGGVASHPSGKWSSVAFSGCTHTTDTIAAGVLEVKNIPGTTNGTIISRETRATLFSTVFGISCIANTGAGVNLGTVTGASSSVNQATVDVNAVIPMGAFCGDSTVTATGIVTNPVGLIIEAS
jgi:hypothetical protein